MDVRDSYQLIISTNEREAQEVRGAAGEARDLLSMSSMITGYQEKTSIGLLVCLVFIFAFCICFYGLDFFT